MYSENPSFRILDSKKKKKSTRKYISKHFLADRDKAQVVSLVCYRGRNSTDCSVLNSVILQ